MTDIPAPAAPEPQPAPEPASAVQAEAEGLEVHQIEWRGHTYTIPRDVDDWPIEALEAFEYGRATAATRALLGPQQWHRFKLQGGRVRDLNDFAAKVAELAGFENLGN